MENIIVIGTGGMLLFALGVIVFVLIHQRRVIRYQISLQKLKEDQQKLLLHATITSEEMERRRIAGELHDEVGASLSAIRLYIRQLPADAWPGGTSGPAAKETLDEVISMVRRISHRLSPEMLTKFGLGDALSHTIQQLHDSGAIRARFESSGELGRLSPERELAIYRIVQELLNNMIKHSGASEIILNISEQARELVVSLWDDGRGFAHETFEALKSTPGGLGLKNIQSRLDILQANINFTLNGPGLRGTTTRLAVPMEEAVVHPDPV
jgi:signal transduction histidine kinase